MSVAAKAITSLKIRLTALKLRNLLNEALKWDMRDIYFKSLLVGNRKIHKLLKLNKSVNAKDNISYRVECRCLYQFQYNTS